jgi:hypothetical protein
MRGEDRNGLPKVIEGAGRQDDLLNYIDTSKYKRWIYERPRRGRLESRTTL